MNEQGERVTQIVKKGMKTQQAASENERLASGKNVALGKMLRWKVRYFTDGVVLGSREFVNGFFEK